MTNTYEIKLASGQGLKLSGNLYQEDGKWIKFKDRPGNVIARFKADEVTYIITTFEGQ